MKKDKTTAPRPTKIGGQAVFEGVMMRGQSMYALAVRASDGSVAIKKQTLAKRGKAFGLPLVRGVVMFVDSLVTGTKVIYDSAEMAGLDDLTEENPSKFDKFLEEKFGDKLFGVVMGVSVVVAMALGIGIFMLLPVFISGLINKLVNGNRFVLTAIEGVVRIAIFLLYMYLVSRMKEIKRMFMYHGAEHKTINCFEAGAELTPENAARHTRLHKRCGTSFLFLVMLISMAFFFLFPVPNLWVRFGTRLLFVPLIAGISYEVLRLAGNSDSLFVRIVSKPGLWLQKLTTIEPDESMLEIAIAAMNAVLEDEPEAR